MTCLLFFFIENDVQLLAVFFSSRRRHTRWTGDWSSDVCSSDLGPAHVGGGTRGHRLPQRRGAAGATRATRGRGLPLQHLPTRHPRELAPLERGAYGAVARRERRRAARPRVP